MQFGGIGLGCWGIGGDSYGKVTEKQREKLLRG
jgi:aryl-alcohol dehydrogenase-like predicted oxidoreductase